MESPFLLETTYIPETEICCGDYAFDKFGKDGNVKKCCGGLLYVPSDKTQICCSNILHDRKSGNFSVFILSTWILYILYFTFLAKTFAQ
jgi:hypothetical protein